MRNMRAPFPVAHGRGLGHGFGTVSQRSRSRRTRENLHQTPPRCQGACPVTTRRVAAFASWPGRFGCYRSKDLPRTNKDLEHLFGSHRYHERRARGRKRAAPGLVVCGSVRVLASVATRLQPEEGLKLRPDYVERWQQTRAQVEKRREARRQQRRFRRYPVNYLKRLEELAIQLSLL